MNQNKALQKHQIHQRKVTLSVWWDYNSVLYFELLLKNQMINSGVYCQRVMKLDEIVKKKCTKLTNRKDVVLLQDNVRPL